ncbi:MAG: hypothetical protein NTW75_15390 [Planctomycetales bacterium]|jgi:hypothetical protein|nr:hypothetical protein [Planctomycetales bacterium]
MSRSRVASPCSVTESVPDLQSQCGLKDPHLQEKAVVAHVPHERFVFLPGIDPAIVAEVGYLTPFRLRNSPPK